MTIRALAFENTLKDLVANYDKPQSKEAFEHNNKMIIGKARILLSRENDSAVIKEMANGVHEV